MPTPAEQMRQVQIGRERERQLIEEAEEAARLSRWRRRQLEATGYLTELLQGGANETITRKPIGTETGQDRKAAVPRRRGLRF